MNKKDIIEKLNKSGLKATHQRVAVLDALMKTKTHPSAEELYKTILKQYPTISLATVYKTLESLKEVGLVRAIKTDCDYVRYDAITTNHFHLYHPEKNKLEDYYDNDLKNMIENYFKNKKIDNFELKEINLQLIGEFK
ncbi:MAG: transcriptional repressor [Candidatus Kapabacteria bacterium]|nr:transcriptional repressor [Candidatus Kapabacteria bacterium]